MLRSKYAWNDFLRNGIYMQQSMAEQCAGILQANVANDVDCNSVRFEIVSGQS
jgi:hypothetical protein